MFSNLFLLNSSKLNKKVSFEDVQQIIKDRAYILINTLPVDEQLCLIKNTVPMDTEENLINQLLQKYEFNQKTIVVYGKNGSDSTADRKYDQLSKLGFSQVYLYPGGLFEWLLLQDIYGPEEFPTTKKVVDILRYKPERVIGRSDRLLTW